MLATNQQLIQRPNRLEPLYVLNHDSKHINSRRYASAFTHHYKYTLYFEKWSFNNSIGHVCYKVLFVYVSLPTLERPKNLPNLFCTSICSVHEDVINI